jgi:hypothetical protein
MIGSRETLACSSAAVLPARSASDASKMSCPVVNCCKGNRIEYRPTLPSTVELCAPDGTACSGLGSESLEAGNLTVTHQQYLKLSTIPAVNQTSGTCSHPSC